jgi:hypothetical protein
MSNIDKLNNWKLICLSNIGIDYTNPINISDINYDYLPNSLVGKFVRNDVYLSGRPKRYYIYRIVSITNNNIDFICVYDSIIGVMNYEHILNTKESYLKDLNE